MFDVVAPETAGLSADRLRRISRWMQRQVELERLPGLSVLVHRRGATAFFDAVGRRDVEVGKPVTADTIFRVYSMTKPITSVAVMLLYEEGAFQLDDPLAKFLPAFEHMQVMTGGDVDDPWLEPASELITIRQLLTHTAGLTYNFMQASPVDQLYRDHRIVFPGGRGSLAETIDRLAALPLLAHPGSQWSYSVATDVLGRLVEVLSGQAFDDFLAERIFQPLGMHDTAFWVPEEKLDRFAAMYGPPGTKGMSAQPARPASEMRPQPPAGLELLDPANGAFAKPAQVLSGGGGLTSTMADYLRFCRMLLNKGELDGVRLLGRKTVEFMTTNHLPGDMASMGQSRFSEAPMEGVGFGLGFSVMLDPARAQTIGSVGEYSWGGAASTGFWIDPAEELIVILMTQLMPSSTWPLRRELHALVHQATID
ncbi:MAG TPA: serine hydrolase domain-containing protein [Gammaproteobacteria bacterium]|nr:serine hydrolase domain-containing protein [Gammaproteobacteria bacterium]